MGIPAHAMTTADMVCPTKMATTYVEPTREYLLNVLLGRFTKHGSLTTSDAHSGANEITYHNHHWIRDSGITVGVVLRAAERVGHPYLQQEIWGKVDQYTKFSRKVQLTPNRCGSPWNGGLGDPRCLLDGTPDVIDWAYPQNDGPALRAIAVTQYARRLMKEDQKTAVKQHLYDGKLPADSVLKADLEYIAHVWKKPCFDIWEKAYGQHFFTLMVQRKALWEGAQLARLLDDAKAGEFYEAQIEPIEKALERHWNEKEQYLRATLHADGGIGYKTSSLDTSVLLGVLLGEIPGRPFGLKDPRVVATVKKLKETFVALYEINKTLVDGKNLAIGPAIGRYPEDRFDGGNPNGKGNPWVLTTAAFAEYYFRIGEKTEGWSYLRRIRHHFPMGARDFTEQFHRTTGKPHGAPSLTWSYSSYLAALLAAGSDD